MTPRNSRTATRRTALIAGVGLGAGVVVEMLTSTSYGAEPTRSTLLPTPTSPSAQTPAASGTPSPSTTSRPATAAPTSATPSEEEARVEALRELEAGIQWRESRAVGQPNRGRLENGVLLPHEGEHFFTWDSPNRRSPSPDGRRWGTGRLVGLVLRLAAEFAADHPDAPRLAVGDLSRPHGGPFGPEFGGRGHVSHQNGLDVDVFYPRLDRAERAPERVEDVDLRLAQDLVGRFVRARARFVFVGPRTGLRGPGRAVQPLRNHDDHLHVRLHPA